MCAINSVIHFVAEFVQTLHVRIIFIVMRYFSVLVQFCGCHEHDDMFISWLKDNIHLGFVRKKFIVYIVHLCMVVRSNTIHG